MVANRVKTGLDHPGYPGQPGHVLSGSSRPNPVYKITGYDQDYALNHM